MCKILGLPDNLQWHQLCDTCATNAKSNLYSFSDLHILRMVDNDGQCKNREQLNDTLIPGNKKLWLRLQRLIILPQRSNRTARSKCIQTLLEESTISSFWLNNVVIQTATPPSYPLSLSNQRCYQIAARKSCNPKENLTLALQRMGVTWILFPCFILTPWSKFWRTRAAKNLLN